MKLISTTCILVFTFFYCFLSCEKFDIPIDDDPLDAILDKYVQGGYHPFLYARLEDRSGSVIYEYSSVNQDIFPGDQIHIPANMKYRFLGNISILQTTTAIMSLYLAFVAATN